MPTTNEINTLLYNLGGEVSNHYHKLQSARRLLEDAVDELMHKIIRLEARVSEGSMFADHAQIYSRDPGVQGERRSNRYRDPSRRGSFERIPVVGIVTGYEIDEIGGVDLIFVIPGRKKEYMANPKFFEVEVLDSFPDID